MHLGISHRIYFVAVGVFALWVGLWGYLVPSEIARAIPWMVPPLHARFLGAMYLSGMVLMFGSRLAQQRAEVRIGLIMASVWTGMLLLVSLLHLAEFNFARPPVWFWFFAYIVFPIVGAWLAWRDRDVRFTVATTPLASWIRVFALVLGIVSGTLALLLFLAPASMASQWPWKIPVLLAQLYSGPFLSFGIGSILISWCGNWQQARWPIWSTATFTALVLLASILHRGLFAVGSTSAIVWFGGFTLALLGLAAAAGQMQLIDRRQIGAVAT